MYSPHVLQRLGVPYEPSDHGYAIENDNVHGERRHESDNLLRVLWLLPPRDEIRVKVGREILVQN